MRLPLLMVLLAAAPARASPVVVYMDRDGGRDDKQIRIPKFGGDDATWQGIVECVERDFAPFAVDIVDQRPAKGSYITAMIGGRPDMLDLGPNIRGISPYNPFGVLRTAVLHVFSLDHDSEDDVEDDCADAAHEIGHALGLDHELACGDIMSNCAPREFLDVSSPCGELSSRVCGNGDGKQNSYRRLGDHVGFRKAAH